MNSSTILTCIGALGVAATAVAAARATPKAIRLLEVEAEEKQKKLTKKEIFQAAAPAYIPVAAIGASTIACIFGANILNAHMQASLTSSYALLNNFHQEYRRTLIELHGKEADEEIRTAMARRHCDFHEIDHNYPDERVMFYDEISGETIVCFEREIMDAEYHLNRNFALRGYAPLNELYMFLGLPQTDYGSEIGWSVTDGYAWIDFEHNLISTDDGGTDIYSIDMIIPPNPDYMREWE